MSNNQLANDLATLRIQREEPPTPQGGSSRRWWWIAGLVLVALIGGLLVAFRGNLSSKDVQTGTIVLVQPGQASPLFVATGTLVAPVTDTLAPRIAGRLQKRLVEEGDEVVPGQPIAVIDPTDLKLALSQAHADEASSSARVVAAKVAVKNAEVKSARADKLFHGAAGTESASIDAALDLDTARAALIVSEADLGQTRARLETAQKNVDDTTLRAPFHGVVLKVIAQPGDFVSTAVGQGVAQLADLSTLEVDAEVSEANLSRLTEKMPVEARLDALPNQGIPGHVFSIRPNVDVAKATAIAKVRLEPPAGSLKLSLFPGMNGRINFLEHEPTPGDMQKPAQLEMPGAALIKEGEQSFVFTVDAKGVVARAPVTTIGTDSDRIVLKPGSILAGTTVITTPAGLQPGDHINLAK